MHALRIFLLKRLKCQIIQLYRSFFFLTKIDSNFRRRMSRTHVSCPLQGKLNQLLLPCSVLVMTRTITTGILDVLLRLFMKIRYYVYLGHDRFLLPFETMSQFSFFHSPLCIAIKL